MQSDNIMDYLFDKRQMDGFINLKDDKLRRKKHEISYVTNNLMHFINKLQISPNNKKSLKLLIDKTNTAIYDSVYREEELIYRNGFIDGFILSMQMFNS